MTDDKDARIAALEAELAERTRDLDYANERAASHLDDAYKLRNELAAERERREAAEAALRQVSLSAAWNSGAQEMVHAHFARYKD